MSAENGKGTPVEEFEVVVVGAGPGGLASAATLGSYGVDTLIVEQRTSPSELPRANTMSTGTMELLRRWGLEKRARERSLEVEFQAWGTPRLTAASEGGAIDVGFPTGRQADIVSPTRPAAIGQDELEPLIEAHVRSLPGIRLERGVELLSLERDDDAGYLLTLDGPGERRRRVHAGYVIGADGMRSKVRRELGIAADDSGNLAERLAVHFRAPLWERLGVHRYVIYFITDQPEGRSFVPVGLPDRWLFAMSWDGPPQAVEALTSELLKELVIDACGDPDLPIEIERAIHVGFGVGLAERFRDGHAFLIGDAAHRVTPRGATGLNMAVRDGFDIGWKLAWVLRGWSGASLLDSYERERRPVAAFNAQRSSKSDGSIIGNSMGLSADIGGRIAHVWVPRDSGLVSTLDLLGDGLTLFVGPDWSGAPPRRDPTSPPVKVARLDAISARGLGLTTAGSLLARPDGNPVALLNDVDQGGPASYCYPQPVLLPQLEHV
jgi:2-polyprenyl-6-methoxyphenol hydroxylase-like FAD-dependent oxidoreductase